MFNINLGTITKENNSLKNVMDSSETFSGELKEGTGILQPTIKLLLDKDVDIGAYNYMTIPKFHRSYWANERVWDKGFWYLSSKVDVLGTYKQNILNSTQYILRASSDSDGAITDTYYPAKNNPNVVLKETEFFLSPDFSNGSYIFGIVNSSGQTIGAVTYYVLNYSEAKAFISALLSNDSWFSDAPTADLPMGTLKTLFNPLQYITTCLFLPISPHYISQDTTVPFKLGWWDLSTFGSAHVLKTEMYAQIEYNLLLSKHPQAANRGSFLNARPFTDIFVQVQPFGRLVIDSGLVMDYDKIKARVKVDCLTGDARLDILTPEDDFPKILAQATANVAVKIPIAQMGADNVKMGTSIGAAIKDTLSLNFGGLVNDIGDALISRVPTAEIRGGAGGILAMSNPLQVITTHYLIVDEDNITIGRPLCQKRQLSSLSGYIKTLNAAIDCGTSEENAQIVNYLNSGVFIE